MEATHSNPEWKKEVSLEGQVTYSLLIRPSSPISHFRAFPTLTLLPFIPHPLQAQKRVLSSLVSHCPGRDTPHSCIHDIGPKKATILSFPALFGYPGWGFPCFSSAVRQIRGYKWKGHGPPTPRHGGLQPKWSPPPQSVAEAFSQREPNPGFNSQASIQPKDSC
jgi:hypothetical protein